MVTDVLKGNNRSACSTLKQHIANGGAKETGPVPLLFPDLHAPFRGVPRRNPPSTLRNSVEADCCANKSTQPSKNTRIAFLSIAGNAHFRFIGPKAELAPG
jgi:hypothetical protein